MIGTEEHDVATDFEAFAADAWPRLYRAAWLLTGQHADAEDLAQQTLLKVHAAWSKVSAARSPMAYSRRILSNTFISATRTRAWNTEVVTEQLPEPVGADPDDPDERLRLWPVVLSLPPRQRAVVVLRYYEGLSEREIADALNCAPGTVKASAHKALKTLRTALDGQDAHDRKGA